MAARISLVYFINSLEVGGAEVGMCRLLDGLDEDKYDVTVVALDGRSSDVTDRIPSWVNVISLQTSVKEMFESSRVLLHSIRNADIIVGSLFHSAMVAKLAAITNPGAKIVTWRHNSEFKTKTRKNIFNLSTEFTDIVLADSKPVKKSLVSQTRVNESIVHIVPIAGIILDEQPQVTHTRTDSPVVGTIGRLIEQKNHMMVLDVAEYFQDTGIQFKIAGDGELRDQLKTEINERQLSNVTLHGFVDDLSEFKSNLDIYFQPSLYEGLCITVLEAMATGLPIVGSDVGGIGENVDHGKNGFLYEPHNVEGFVSGIKKLSNDPRLRAKFGERCRELVSNKYTQNVLVSEFERAIKQV